MDKTMMAVLALSGASLGLLGGCGTHARVEGRGYYAPPPSAAQPVSPFRGRVFHAKQPAAPTVETPPTCRTPGTEPRPIYTEFDNYGEPLHTHWRCLRRKK